MVLIYKHRLSRSLDCTDRFAQQMCRAVGLRELLTLVTAKLTLKGALFTITRAFAIPMSWKGEQTCVILRSQA